MSSQEKSTRPKQFPLHRKPAPLTIERLVPLFEDMKDFVRATVRGSETVLRQEMQDIRTELKNDIRVLDTKVQVMDKKIDVIQCAITEHTKTIKKVELEVEDHELRLTHVEHRPS